MKFNQLFTRKQKKTKNHEGAVAYKLTPEMELYSAVVCSTLDGTFYESGKDRLNRIKQLINKVKPEFVAQLAVYCRQKMYLRSVPLVLTVELAKKHNGDDLISRMTKGVVQRADEITELLAYYQLANERKGEKKLNQLSKQLQKGLASAFYKFDEYQFAKYNRKGSVSLKDALFLAHPKAQTEAQQVLFKKIANDQLEVPYTWEVELSKLGQITYKNTKQKEIAVRKKWEELIDSGRLGYMALMRNLRNILQANVSNKHIQKVAAKLADPQAVAKSRQLPFRFLSAYRELKALNLSRTSYLLKALEKAVQQSILNLKGFDLDTKILLASDVSGSMCTPISQKSKIQAYDIGLLLSMLMASKSDNVITGIFGDRWKAMNMPASTILENTMTLRKISGQVGYSTNGYKVIDALIRKGEKVDKVMFFTDLQMWDSRHGGNSLKKSWTKYKKQIAPHAKLYLFDLVGYGKTPISINDQDVFLIAGWSNKIFDVLAAIEDGKRSLKAIKQMTL